MTKFDQEWQKMLSGEVYDAFMPEFHDKLIDTRRALWRFNNLDPADIAAQHEILRSLFGSCGENLHVNQPFRCDYGCNIHIGDNFFANFNLTVLDEAPVTIGNRVLIGPNVSIYTACHPLDRERRDAFVEWAEPVTIGDSVWIGGGATILPGVTLGDNVIVAAASVVTRSFPSDVLIAGNPARIIKSLFNNKCCR